jgi:hypothetical protein|tara:strand:+ start:65 stop:514 length:450 start_codon:yes stop_codon:yes gene_type:complete
MSLYKEFSTLLPYIQSVRKLKNYLSFDVSFPKTWKLPKKYIEEDKILEQESTIIDNRFFSFVSEITEEGVENTSKNIQNIIKYNLEREEKEKLFQNKVDELKHIFEKQNLKNLKSLQFEIKNNKLELEYDEEELEGTRVVPERINKGQD